MVPPDSDRVPPAPPYSGFGLGSWRIPRTGLSPPLARLSRRVPLSSRSPCRPPYNPARASTPAVWAVPLSLAATRGVTVVFLSSDYLDVSVRRVRLLCQDDWPSASRVSPFGHPRIKGRSRLPAAFRSLPRPSSPPGAKASSVRLTVLVAYRARPAASRRGTSRVSSLFLLSFLRGHGIAPMVRSDCSCVFPSILSKNRPPPLGRGRSGEQGIRTLDPRLAEPMLWPAELAPLKGR